MIFESLYFRCFDHFSLFVCTNLTNNFRYFSIIFLRVFFSRYQGKNMQEFFNLFFIEINLSTTCSNKNFLRWASKPILFNCFLLVVYCLFLNFCSKLPIWSAMVEGFVGVEWSNLGLINFCYGSITILNLEPL